MNNNPMACDPDRIELFLRHQLADDEQTALELHLDDCCDCRRRLESTAANDEIWQGVLDSLPDEQSLPDGQRSGREFRYRLSSDHEVSNVPSAEAESRWQRHPARSPSCGS